MGDRLKNKVAIVFGAGPNIGGTIAHFLAREGASVMLTDVDEARWKIAKRRELIDWARTDPSGDSFLTGPMRLVFGARGDADFSNQRVWPQ